MGIESDQEVAALIGSDVCELLSASLQQATELGTSFLPPSLFLSFCFVI